MRSTVVSTVVCCRISSIYLEPDKPTEALKMFGSSTNTSFGTRTGFGTGLLGASEAAPKGTPVKFSVVQGYDIMVQNGITTNISARYQSITFMSDYDKKSIEELRIEDYEAGRKKVCSGSLFGSSSDSGFSTSSSLTGLQPTTGFGAAGEPHCSSPTYSRRREHRTRSKRQ